MEITQILALRFFDNSVLEYLVALGIVVGAIVASKLLKVFVIGKLKSAAKKTSNDFDDFIIESINKIGWPFFGAAGLYIATLFLTLPNAADKIFLYLFVAVATYRAVKIVQDAIKFVLSKTLAKKDGEESGGTAIAQTVGGIANVIVWLVAIVLVLSNMGVNVTSLVAGLGISGIAIALAAQAVFKDAFSAITIYIDRPFQVGDFIIFDGKMGTVEKIGIKTTRIMSLEGQGLIVPNSALTDATIQNYKKMKSRRMSFTIGVTYDTPVEKLRKIPEMITKIIEGIEDAIPNRCHFSEYADSSLNFETVYYIESADFTQHMDIQQTINLTIKEAFEKEGIEMAFPTRTVHLKKEG